MSWIFMHAPKSSIWSSIYILTNICITIYKWTQFLQLQGKTLTKGNSPGAENSSAIFREYFCTNSAAIRGSLYRDVLRSLSALITCTMVLPHKEAVYQIYFIVICPSSILWAIRIRMNGIPNFQSQRRHELILATKMQWDQINNICNKA